MTASRALPCHLTRVNQRRPSVNEIMQACALQTSAAQGFSNTAPIASTLQT